MDHEPDAGAAGGMQPGAYVCTDVKGKSRPYELAVDRRAEKPHVESYVGRLSFSRIFGLSPFYAQSVLLQDVVLYSRIEWISVCTPLPIPSDKVTPRLDGQS